MPRCVRVLARLILVTASFASAAMADTPAAPTTDLAQLFEAIQRPAVTGLVDAPAELRIGRAQIQPASGAKLLVISALGRPCGLVLDGPARLTYRVEDRFSIPVASRNLKRASGVHVALAGDVLVATSALTGAAIWGWDIELPSAPVAAPVGSALPEWLIDVLEGKLSGNPARDVLSSGWNSDSGYRWATLRGAGDDLELDVDPRPSVQQEQLARWRKLDSVSGGSYRGRLVTEELAAQPTSGAWWDAPRLEFATIETDLQLVNAAGDHATVATRVKVRSLRDRLRLLSLELVREVSNDYGQRAPFTVSKLTVDGQPATFVQSGLRDLLVALPRALAVNEDVTLEMVAEGNILGRPAGDNYWRLGLFPWYPKPGGTGQEWSSFRIDALSQSPFVPVPAGRVVSSETTPAGSRVVTALEGPMQGAVIVAGKYSTLTEELEGRRVHVSTYAWAKETEARKLARNVLSICMCLENWLGVPYPFKDLKLIEITDWGWGQAPPGVIFITKEAFLSPGRARLDEETQQTATWATRGINERIAHEVAHGWFPHVAKVVRTEENWLSESFADYASAVCLERTMSDKSRARFFWERQLQDWKEGARHAGQASVFLAAHLTDSEKDARTWRDLLYAKGPLVLHALRAQLARDAGDEKEGDRLFLTWVRSYVKNFVFKPGETRHLVAILNKITSKDWQPWFERYVYGTETPRLD